MAAGSQLGSGAGSSAPRTGLLEVEVRTSLNRLRPDLAHSPPPGSGAAGLGASLCAHRRGQSWQGALVWKFSSPTGWAVVCGGWYQLVVK